MDQPSWLSDDTSTPAAGTAAPIPSAVSSMDKTPTPTPAASRSGGLTAQQELDEKELPGIILVMRLANMGVSIAVMACSIFLMVGLPSLSNWVLAVYATCGGLLICCLETQLKFLRVMIAVNFGFLFNSVWRFLYYTLLGSVTWAYGNLLGRIVAIALFTLAVINTYILCRYPSYRRIRDQIAEEEDKRIEARISKEVRSQAVRGFTGGR